MPNQQLSVAYDLIDLSHLDGLLSFPVTPFGDDGELDVPRLREHVRGQIETGASALFVACGTGEFFSLNLAEHRLVTVIAVEEAGGEIPVYAGVGYGTRIAIELTQVAERAGADGVLVLPPYLITADQQGLYSHYRQIAEATHLPVLLYQRDNARLTPDTIERLAQLSTVVGLKDGIGDVAALARVRARLGYGFPIINGMPTAELSEPEFRWVGAFGYSSAVLNFIPELACAYRAAVDSRRGAEADRYLSGFFRPYAELRDETRGFTVALVKAGMDIVGRSAGPVRPPLVEPNHRQLQRLRSIVDRGRELVHS